MTDVTVLVVDDDPLVCGYLRQELEAVDGVHVLDTAGDGAEAVDLATRTRPDVVLMDIRMRGVDVLSPEATQRLLRLAGTEARPASDPRVDALSEREREVLHLVGEGRSNAEVARSLYLAESTVKGHVSRLMEKLGCTNRTQLAILSGNLPR